MHFVLVSSCDEEGATHEYSLARRDVATGATERLASGDSRAGAALGPEGSIYLEVGGRIERFAPGQRESISATSPHPPERRSSRTGNFCRASATRVGSMSASSMVASRLAETTISPQGSMMLLSPL